MRHLAADPFWTFLTICGPGWLLVAVSLGIGSLLGTPPANERERQSAFTVISAVAISTAILAILTGVTFAAQQAALAQVGGIVAPAT